MQVTLRRSRRLLIRTSHYASLQVTLKARMMFRLQDLMETHFNMAGCQLYVALKPNCRQPVCLRGSAAVCINISERV